VRLPDRCEQRRGVLVGEWANDDAVTHEALRDSNENVLLARHAYPSLLGVYS
jgi:hypothetical protein